MTASTTDAREPDSAPIAPVLLVDVELSQPLPDLEAGEGERGIRYGSALCTVRLHGRVLGAVTVELPEEGLLAKDLAARIETELSACINVHLEEDGLEPMSGIGAAGIPCPDRPLCMMKRDEFLAGAPFVSVIIPTRDRPALAAEAVESVLGSEYPSDRFEVILVDNRPDPVGESSAEIAAPFEDDRVTVLHEPVSGGANARNTGLAHARGEIAAFTDDDVLADPEWLSAIARSFAEAPNVGAVSGVVMPREMETPAQVWYEGYARFSERFVRRAYDFGPNRPLDDPLFPFNIGVLGTGANMAFRTEVLRDVGGFDPSFNTQALPNGTDVEAIFRVMLRGWTVVREPAAIVQHAHQREYAQLKRRVYGYGLGLTGLLTKSVVHNPRLILELLHKLPRGVVFALSSRSEKNASKHAEFPPALNQLELRGMLRGPSAYFRGRREAKRARRATKHLAGSNLRVLLVTDSYPPLVGGATFWSRGVARYMCKRGHTVAVATAWQPKIPTRELDGSVEVFRLRDLTSRVPGVSADPYRHSPPPFPDPEATFRLRRLIRRFEPDLVHSYGWLTHSVAAALTGTDVPLLVSTQDYSNVCALRTLFRHDEICTGPNPVKCLECAGSHYGAAKGTAAVAGVLGSRRLLRRRTTMFHSISRYVAEVVERDLQAPANTPIEIIPNFYETDPGQAVDADILAQLPDEPFILFVGALRRVKGIEELCAAYEQLEQAPPMVLAGPLAPDTPPEFPAGVTVLTSVPHPTVMAMWDRALFGAFPSKWPEPLGNVVFEAMSRGSAVIGSYPGGHADMIDEGATGLLIPAGDVAALASAMSRLIEDTELRQSMGREAAKRAANYRGDIILPQLESLYHRAVAVSGGKPRRRTKQPA